MLLKAESVHIFRIYPRYRFTMLERSYHASRPENFIALCWNCWKSSYSLQNLPMSNTLGINIYKQKYLPIYRMVSMTLRVTWSHRIQYNYWNRTIVKSKANFDAFRTSMFILLFSSPSISWSGNRRPSWTFKNSQLYWTRTLQQLEMNYWKQCLYLC